MKQFDPNQRWVGKFTLGRHEAIGDLTYDTTKGIKLEARVCPAPKEDPPFIYPHIAGHVGGDRPCALFDAVVRGRRKTSGEQLHDIAVNTIVLGLDCKSPDKPLFTDMRFCSPALTAFVQPRNIKVKRSYRPQKFTISYRRVKAKTGKWKGHKITIDIFGDTSLRQARDGTVEALELPIYSIKFNELASLNDVLSHLTALEFFLGLVTGQFAGAPSVSLVAPDHCSPIQLFRSRSWYTEFDYETYRVSHVSMGEFGRGAISVMARWLDMFPNLEGVTETYRAAQLIPEIETNFIFLTQALEGLHRVYLNKKAISDKEFEQGVTALRAAIPSRLRPASKTFFRDRIPSQNEPGLATRLKDLLKRVRAKIPMALEHGEKDIRGIVNFRNEFSHGTLGKMSRPLNYELMNYYAHFIQTLFDLNLLILLGVSKEVLSEMYYGSPQYSHNSDRRLRLERKDAVRSSRSRYLR